MQAGADGVGIVALVGEKIGGPLLGQGDYLFECGAVRRFAGEAFLSQSLSHASPTF